jgi:hypothetical protein
MKVSVNPPLPNSRTDLILIPNRIEDRLIKLAAQLNQ